MRRFLLLIIISLFALYPFLMAAPARAGFLSEAQNKLSQAVGGGDIGFEKDIASPIGTVVKVALSLVGTIFLLLTVYAGILWMTAAGKEEQVEKAKKIIYAAVIGLFITMAAYAITTFITIGLGGTGGGGTPREGGNRPTPVAGAQTCGVQGGQCEMDDDDCSTLGIFDDYTGQATPASDCGLCCLLKENTVARCEAKGGRCIEQPCAETGMRQEGTCHRVVANDDFCCMPQQ